MVVKRDAYLNRLISKKHNGLIKVVQPIDKGRRRKKSSTFHIEK